MARTMTATSTSTQRVAYSYLRYSDPSQSRGDSARRQLEGPLEWCKRNGVRLDDSKRMEDRGLSAYDGAHIHSGALGQFLAEVAAGRIAVGSILIIENLDRLSRENPWDAIPILCNLVNAGITVVTLSPSEMIYERERDNLTALMLAVIEFSRSHLESKNKGGRVGKAWVQKKTLARTEKKVLTRSIPNWLEFNGEDLAAIPERVATIERMFALAIDGYGMDLICKKLDAEGHRAFNRSGRWNGTYIHRILTGRAVRGEYQPHAVKRVRGARKGRAPEGDPIPDYYPVVIDQITWDRAQAAIARRDDGGRPRGGRVGKAPDLFSRKLFDAGNNCKMHVARHTCGDGPRTRKVKVIAPADHRAGRTTFRYDIFEAAILAKLREASAAEVLGAEPQGESAAIAGALAAKEARLKVLQTELSGEGGDVRALIAAAKVLDHERQVLLRKLSEARGREANPRAEALAEVKTLADCAADPHTRMRLRSLLQTLIESVHVLIVPRRSVRLVAAQVTFAGGESRNYFIEYRAGSRWNAEQWEPDTFKLDGALLDLRRRGDVAKMRRVLEHIHDRLEAGAGRPGL